MSDMSDKCRIRQNQQTSKWTEKKNTEAITSPWIQRAVSSKYEISIFKKLGVGWKGTAPNARRLHAEDRCRQYAMTTMN
jgi:hypothetical protein